MSLAAIEGGGTKFLCAVGEGPEQIRDRCRIETTTPAETLERIAAFFAPHEPSAVGAALFGPLELETGRLGRTPKPGWSGFPAREQFARTLGAPVTVETDVNAAALAERRWGAAQGLDPVAYLTVGTGIGAGLFVHGRPVHGLLHPELGHIPVPRLAFADGTLDPFAGSCPYHGRCLEGVASGTALRARLLGEDPQRLAPDDPLLALVGRYLAHAVVTLVLTVSPARIVIGGGVMRTPGLLARVRGSTLDLLGGYIHRPELGAEVDRYIVAPAFPDPGLAGAFALVMP